MRHLTYEERLQRLGLHSLKRRWLRDDLITAFKIFKSLLDIDLNLVFLPPARRGHRRRRWSAFSVRVVKYWNKLPASVVTAPSVNVFKKRLEEVWTEAFPHLPQWLNTHPTPFLLPLLLFPPAHHPWAVIISLCYPTPCSLYVVSSGPLWPTFYCYK